MNETFTEQEAARILGVAVHTVRNWRSQGHGPTYVKHMRAVRYRWDDLVKYLDAHRVIPEPLTVKSAQSKTGAKKK